MSEGNNARLPEKEIREVLDRTASFVARLSRSDVPEDLKHMGEQYLVKTQDKVTGLQPRWALDEAVDDLRKKEIPHAVAAVDFRNLGGLNTEYGHEKTNQILEEVAKRHMQTAAREWGGEVYRSGGDEFHVVVPYLKADELDERMKGLQEKIQKDVVERWGIAFLPHKSQNGMPTGAGNIDYGCVDSSNTKSRSEMMKAADQVCYDNKRAYLEQVKAREIDYGRLWEFDKGEQRYKLSVDLSKEKEYESKFTRSADKGRGSEGLEPQGSSVSRDGNREREFNKIGKTSSRDERGVREEKGGVPEEERRADEKKSPGEIVGELVAYAGSKCVVVKDETRDIWKKLIENGRDQKDLRNYIDDYAESIKGPEVKKDEPKPGVEKKTKEPDKEIGMDI